MRGAALATVIAQASSVLFSLGYMRRPPLPFSVRGRRRDVPRAVGRILRLGTPIALQDFLTTISFLIITSIVNSLGLVASAGVGISEKLYVFLSIVPMSFMSALSTFVAQNMGAGQPLRARKALFAAQKVSLCFGAVIFTLTFWGGGLLAALFSRDAAVIEAAALYMNAARAGKRALAICTVSDQLVRQEFTTSEERQTGFTQMMQLALETAIKLEK